MFILMGNMNMYLHVLVQIFNFGQAKKKIEMMRRKKKKIFLAFEMSDYDKNHYLAFSKHVFFLDMHLACWYHVCIN